jgi:predicted nucleic acid-binding protein
VLPFDAAAAIQYAAVASARELEGTPISGFDAQIASVCRVHQAALATRNGKDFQYTGLDIIDPWATHT